MSDIRLILPLLALILLAQTFHISLADVGTGSRYSPPYTPNACYGGDSSRLPRDNMFAAAGEGIWDNGAACGRRYLVRCISSTAPSRACILGKTIRVVIVDRAQTTPSRPTRPGTTFVFSDDAYSTIANPSVPSINVEFQQII